MNPKQWKLKDYSKFTQSVQSHWNIQCLHTLLPISNTPTQPFYISGIGPVCREIIRKLYRIGTFGFVTKIRASISPKRQIYTKCFWKELSLDSSQCSPLIEIYATLCASYLRNKHHTKGLAYCYGFCNGTLASFTLDRHRSSIQSISNLTHHGIRIRRIQDDTYINIERQQEEVCLLSSEYFPLTFDECLDKCKTKSEKVEMIYDMIHQVAHGIVAMETEWGIRHNDLHLGNVMGRYEKNGTTRWSIIDWGRATVHRPGCHQTNTVFTTQGSAYGQHKMTSFPLAPTSKQSYYEPTQWGDFVCLLVMLQKESNPIWKSLLKKYPHLSPWIPNKPIRGDGLHVFRKANEWVAKHPELDLQSFLHN